MEHKLYCKNGEWNYTARIVNFGNFTIQYITKGGFQSKDKAQKSYQEDYEKYKSDIKKSNQ